MTVTATSTSNPIINIKSNIIHAKGEQSVALITNSLLIFVVLILGGLQDLALEMIYSLKW